MCGRTRVCAPQTSLDPRSTAALSALLVGACSGHPCPSQIPGTQPLLPPTQTLGLPGQVSVFPTIHVICLTSALETSCCSWVSFTGCTCYFPSLSEITVMAMFEENVLSTQKITLV